MRFSDILGHDALKRRLRESIREGRVPHTQLLSGRAGYGALPLALAYVQYLNCPNRTDDDSCGVCASCHQMGELAHPDLHLVMPVNKQGKKSGERVLSEAFMPLFRQEFSRSRGYLTSGRWYESMELGKTLKGAISVHEADEIIRRLSFKSYSGGYKAMIIWLPEMMGEPTSNKLLKILEEPWDDTLFILVSESPEVLLPTILSRTQQIALPQIDMATMERYAQSRGVADKQRRGSVARLSGGDKVEMERLLSGDGAQSRVEYFEFFARLMRLSYNDKHLELLEWAEEVAQQPRTEQIEMLRHSITLLREAYIRHAGLEQLCYTWGDEATFCQRFSPFIGNENIEFLVEECERAIAELSQSANPTILFTHFALKVSREIVKR